MTIRRAVRWMQSSYQAHVFDFLIVLALAVLLTLYHVLFISQSRPALRLRFSLAASPRHSLIEPPSWIIISQPLFRFIDILQLLASVPLVSPGVLPL